MTMPDPKWRPEIFGVRLIQRKGFSEPYYDARTPVGTVAICRHGTSQRPWEFRWWPPRWSGRCLVLDGYSSAKDAATEGDAVLDRAARAFEVMHGVTR